jgi:hypothetical protein
MSFSLALLLIHSAHDIPSDARLALRAALDAPAEQRQEHLTRAAKILYATTGVDCADARELVGLPNAPNAPTAPTAPTAIGAPREGCG